MKTLLFLGDSITDCDHCFDSENLGYGYVRKISDHLKNAGIPASCFNHATDGFTITRILDRYRREYRSLQPDIITILAGINDISTIYNLSSAPGLQRELFAEIKDRFRTLIKEIHRHCDCPVVLLEPFLIPYPVSYRNWEPLLNELQDFLRALADEQDILYLPLQQHLSAACIRQGCRTISPDGIHLTETGHDLLSVIWLSTCKELL